MPPVPAGGSARPRRARSGAQINAPLGQNAVALTAVTWSLLVLRQKSEIVRGEGKPRVPYDIAFEPDAVEHLRAFSTRDRAIVLDQIEVQLTHQPDVETRHRKRLRRNPLAPWELWIGEMRVFYDVHVESASVRVIAVGRKEGNRLMIAGEEMALCSALPLRIATSAFRN